MRVRPFVRISGNLSMTTSDLSAKIPPFNAQRMLTDVGTTTPAASDDPNNPDAVEPDAEVSFVTKDLAPVLPKAKTRRRGRARRGPDAGARCRELARQRAASATPRSPMPPPTPAAPSPTSSWPTPPKATSPIPMPASKPAWCRKTSRCCRRPRTRSPAATRPASAFTSSRRATRVASILRDQGATPDEAKAIALTLGPRGRDGGLKEGQKLRILMAPRGPAPGARLQPYRVIVANDTTVEAVAALSDLGKYVAVDVQSMNTVAETATGKRRRRR